MKTFTNTRLKRFLFLRSEKSFALVFENQFNFRQGKRIKKLGILLYIGGSTRSSIWSFSCVSVPQPWCRFILLRDANLFSLEKKHGRR